MEHPRIDHYLSARQSSRRKWFVAALLGATALLFWTVR